MGGNISFEWGLYGLNRDGDFPIIVSEDADAFWDEVMVEVCRWIVVVTKMEVECTPLSSRRMRFVIEHMLRIDAAMLSDQKVLNFAGIFYYIDGNFTRDDLLEELKQRTEFQKYLES